MCQNSKIKLDHDSGSNSLFLGRRCFPQEYHNQTFADFLTVNHFYQIFQEKTLPLGFQYMGVNQKKGQSCLLVALREEREGYHVCICVLI